MKTFKLGRNPVQYSRTRLHFSRYLNKSTIKLPTTQPLNLGTPLTIKGMLCNGPDPLNPPSIRDGIGCCFWAAMLRQSVARANSAGAKMGLNMQWAVNSVIEAYSKCTGFNVNDPDNTDNGTDPDSGFAYMRSTGIRLQDGIYDKFGVPVAVNPQDFEEVLIAHNLFGTVAVGVQFPDSWEAADIWDEGSDPAVGGHEIASLSDLNLTPEGIEIDSWGTTRIITPAGLAQRCDQLTVCIDPKFFLKDGKAVNGFDAEQLATDEKLIAA